MVFREIRYPYCLFKWTLDPLKISNPPLKGGAMVLRDGRGMFVTIMRLENKINHQKS